MQIRQSVGLGDAFYIKYQIKPVDTELSCFDGTMTAVGTSMLFAFLCLVHHSHCVHNGVQRALGIYSHAENGMVVGTHTIFRSRFLFADNTKLTTLHANVTDRDFIDVRMRAYAVKIPISYIDSRRQAALTVHASVWCRNSCCCLADHLAVQAWRYSQSPRLFVVRVRGVYAEQRPPVHGVDICQRISCTQSDAHELQFDPTRVQCGGNKRRKRNLCYFCCGQPCLLFQTFSSGQGKGPSLRRCPRILSVAIRPGSQILL